MELLRKLPLNFGLMANPANWIIVTLMVMLASMSLTTIVAHSKG